METINTSMTAARNSADFLRAICEKGNTACARHLKKDESTISRFKSGAAKFTIEEFSELCAFIGLRINHISASKVTIDTFEYGALITIGQFAMSNLPVEDKPVRVPSHLYNSMAYLSAQRLHDMRRS